MHAAILLDSASGRSDGAVARSNGSAVVLQLASGLGELDMDMGDWSISAIHDHVPRNCSAPRRDGARLCL